MLQNLLHLDKFLPQLITQYGTAIYAILFAVVFCETGLVFLPILPGDSLLFAAGAVSIEHSLSWPLLYPLFIAAAFAGDNVNYWVGREFGRKLFSNENSKIFKKSNLDKTEDFFKKHGPKAVIIARFVPIVRTFAPFVSGMGQMHYATFLAYSIAGATFWVGVCVTAGHLLGSVPFFKKHFELLVLAVVVLSLIPVVIEFMLHRKAAKAEDGKKSEG